MTEIPNFPNSVPSPLTKKHTSSFFLVGLLLVGLVAGGVIGSAMSFVTLNGKIGDLQTDLQTQLARASERNLRFLL